MAGGGPEGFGFPGVGAGAPLGCGGGLCCGVREPVWCPPQPTIKNVAASAAMPRRNLDDAMFFVSERRSVTQARGSRVYSLRRYYRNRIPVPQGTLLELSPRVRYKLDRYKQKFNDMFSSGQDEEKPRPRLCPNCGTLVGATATKCYACGANVNFGMAAARKSLGRLLPAESPVSYLILGVTCIFYAITFALTVRVSGGISAPSGGGDR